MKTPICEADAKSGTLCAAHQEALSKGELTEADVEISRLLHKYREQFSLDAVQVSKAIDCGRLVVVVSDSDAGMLIGKGGKIVSVIAKDYGKQLKIIQRGDLRKMVDELVLPVRVLGVNEVFKSGGREYRIRIKRSDEKRLPLDLKSIESVLNSLWHEKTAVAFE